MRVTEFILGALLLSASVLVSCEDNNEPDETNGNQEVIKHSSRLPKTQEVINFENVDMNYSTSFSNEKGGEYYSGNITISVKPNSIKLLDGTPAPNGKYKIGVREYLTLEDMLKSGVTTTSDGKLLVTGGALYWEIQDEKGNNEYKVDGADMIFNMSDELLSDYTKEMKYFKGEVKPLTKSVDKEVSILNWIDPRDVFVRDCNDSYREYLYGWNDGTNACEPDKIFIDADLNGVADLRVKCYDSETGEEVTLNLDSDSDGVADVPVEDFPPYAEVFHFKIKGKWYDSFDIGPNNLLSNNGCKWGKYKNPYPNPSVTCQSILAKIWTGFVNCDAFYRVDNSHTQFKVQVLANPKYKIQGAMVFAKISSINTVFQLYREGAFYKTYKKTVPRGAEVKLIVVGENANGELFLKTKKVRIERNDMLFVLYLEPATATEIKNALSER